MGGNYLRYLAVRGSEAYQKLKAERDRLQARVTELEEKARNLDDEQGGLWCILEKAEQERDEARAEVERLRELIDREIMPRYVELFEGFGLGDDASQSALVQIVRDAINRT